MTIQKKLFLFGFPTVQSYALWTLPHRNQAKEENGEPPPHFSPVKYLSLFIPPSVPVLLPFPSTWPAFSFPQKSPSAPCYGNKRNPNRQGEAQMISNLGQKTFLTLKNLTTFFQSVLTTKMQIKHAKKAIT